MDQDIVDGKIGQVGNYDVEFKQGKLSAKVDISKEISPGVSVKGEVMVEIGGRAVLDALKRLIPGQIDDMVIELAEKALGV